MFNMIKNKQSAYLAPSITQLTISNCIVQLLSSSSVMIFNLLGLNFVSNIVIFQKLQNYSGESYQKIGFSPSLLLIFLFIIFSILISYLSAKFLRKRPTLQKTILFCLWLPIGVMIITFMANAYSQLNNRAQVKTLSKFCSPIQIDNKKINWRDRPITIQQYASGCKVWIRMDNNIDERTNGILVDGFGVQSWDSLVDGPKPSKSLSPKGEFQAFFSKKAVDEPIGCKEGVENDDWIRLTGRTNLKYVIRRVSYQANLMNQAIRPNCTPSFWVEVTPHLEFLYYGVEND